MENKLKTIGQKFKTESETQKAMFYLQQRENEIED